MPLANSNVLFTYCAFSADLLTSATGEPAVRNHTVLFFWDFLSATPACSHQAKVAVSKIPLKY